MFMNDLKESNNKEIIFPEIDGEILQKLIHYCYTGELFFKFIYIYLFSESTKALFLNVKLLL